MAEASGLPAMPTTVDLGGAGDEIEGDPLEYMRAKSREYIESVNKNPIAKENEKVEFKKYVLKKLQENIKEFEKIDAEFEAQKAEEEATAAEEGLEGEEEPTEEEDPFADIFGGEGGETDEATEKKKTLAGAYVKEIKNYKTKFLRKIRIKREKQAKVEDERKMEEILGKLESV